MTCMMKKILVALLLALTFCTVAQADGQPEDALVRLERAFEESDVALMKDVFDPALLRTIDIGSQLFDMALSPMKTTMTMNSLCGFFAPMTDMPALLGMEPDDLKPGARDLVWTVVSKRQTSAEEAYLKVIVTLEDELISEPGGETLYFRCRDGKWYISVEGLVLEPEKKVNSTGPQSALDRMILGLNKLNFKAAAKAYDPYLREIYGDTYTWFNKLLPLGENGKLVSETLDKVSEAAKWLDLLSELGGYEMNLFPLFYDVLSCQVYGETAEMQVVFYLEGKLLSPEGGTRIWFREVDGKWYISEEGIEKIAPKHQAAKEPEDTLKKIKEGLETLDIDLIEEAFDPEIVNYLYAQQGIENKLIRGVTGVNLASVSKLVLSMRPLLVSYVDAPELEYDIISSKVSGDRAILRVSLEVDGDYLTALEGDNMFFRLIDGEWYITYPTKEQYFELFGNECPHLGGRLELDDIVTYEYEAAETPYQHRVIEVTICQWSCRDCGAVQSTEERAEWAMEEHTASDTAYCSLCGALYVAPPTPAPTLTPTPTATPTAMPTPAPTAEPTAAPTATPAPNAVPTVAPTVTPAPTAVPTVAPTATPVPTAVPTVAPTATPVPTAVPTATPTATPVPTAVPTATPTATPAPTATAAPVVTETPIPAKLPIAQEEGAYQHRTQQAAANSHVVANSGDYSAAMAVDGNEATSWQFSTKKVKLGEAALVIALQPGSTVDELWIKNGFWFINNGLDQYTRNGRPKEIAVGFLYDGESEYSDEVKLRLRDDKERKDWQKLNLGRHENVSAVRIRVISIYKGTKFTTDVAISEVMLVEREGDIPAIVYETLQRGNKSEEVLAMKERLRELGYFKKNADLSNSYNDTCVERVKQFQKVNGLPQTGIADHQTLMLLYSDAALPKSN